MITWLRQANFGLSRTKSSVKRTQAAPWDAFPLMYDITALLADMSCKKFSEKFAWGIKGKALYPWFFIYAVTGAKTPLVPSSHIQHHYSADIFGLSAMTENISKLYKFWLFNLNLHVEGSPSIHCEETCINIVLFFLLLTGRVFRLWKSMNNFAFCQ